MKTYIWLVISIFTLSSSCKKTEIKERKIDSKGYFSVIQFAQDQFKYFSGQPYTLQKIVTLNGKSDTVFVHADTLDWAMVLQPFFESDISHPQFIDKYNFTMFEDKTMETRTFYYEAKEPELLTRVLQVSSDIYNNRIQTIFIETNKNGTMKKLLYKPVTLIQIQEYESSFLGEDKELMIEYYFM